MSGPSVCCGLSRRWRCGCAGQLQSAEDGMGRGIHTHSALLAFDTTTIYYARCCAHYQLSRMSTNINRLGCGGMKGIQALAAPGELGCEMTRVSNVSVVWPVAVRTNSRVQGRCHSSIADPGAGQGGLYTTHLSWWRNGVAGCRLCNI